MVRPVRHRIGTFDGSMGSYGPCGAAEPSHAGDYDVQLVYMLCYSHLNIESHPQTVASLEWRENEVLVLKC